MANNEETSCRPLALLAIVVALVVFVFPLCLRFPLMDPDEGLHASIAQEMVERGDWITPRFLGQPFFDKPILYFWIQAASLRLFGANELAVRLPGLMFGLLGAATTGLLAWRMFGRKTGWIAGIFYATTIMPTALAQAASHDVALVPWVNLAILLLWESDCGKRMRRGTAQPVGRMSEHYVAGSCGQPSPPAPLPPTGEGSCEVGVRRRLLQVGGCTIGAGVFLGLSILTKGLLGVAVVGLAYGGYRLITWRARPAVLLQGAIVLFVAGLIAAPWYLAVAARQPHFLRYYFFERHVLGFATGTQPHSDQPWWYYLPILLGGGLPWIAYVRWAGSGTQKAEGGGRRAEGGGRRAEGGGRKAEGERRAEGGRRKAEGGTPPTLPRAETAGPSALRPPPSALAFLWFWLIGWVVFVTMAQSKLATYLWPAFPPLAILAAVAWTRLIEGSLTEAARRSFARTFVSSSWGGPIVLPAAVAVLQSILAIRFGWPVWTAVVLVAAASPLPLLAWRAGRRQASMAAAALSLAAQFVVVMTLVLPRLAEMYSARELAEHFNRLGRVPPRLRLAEERVGSLVFYLDPRLRAGLTQDQVEYLASEGRTSLRPGDVVAVKERNVAKANPWLGLGDKTFERVGQYRLYRVAKPQAAD